jgi:protein O-mannosyl-transferase
VLTALAFLPVGRHQFVNYDDNYYVTENPTVQAGVTGAGLGWAFGRLQGEHTYWHPVTWVSHMVDCLLFGLNPAGHHLVNLLFHTLNVVLVFLVFYRLTKAFWRSALLSALFALHPLQVDTVAWVAERKNLLSAAFWLLTMWAYVRYTEVQSPKSRVQSPTPDAGGTSSLFHLPSSIFYLLTVLSFALGLMCKPVLVTLPFVLLLLDYWPLQRLPLADFKTTAISFTRLVWEKTPLFLLAGGSCLITIIGHRSLKMLADTAHVPLSLRAANAVVSYVRYLGKVICPVNLAVLYPYPNAWAWWKVVLCGLVLLCLSCLAIRAARTRPYLFTGWFWFMGVLVPFIGLIKVGDQAMADRFMYMPILGLFLCVVWGLGERRGEARGARGEAPLAPTRWPRPSYRWPVAASTAALLACLVCTGFQLRHWQNSETLFRHAIEVTSGNYTAYDGLGIALQLAGKREEAIACYTESVRLKPHHKEGHYNLGTLLMTMGRLDEAIPHLKATVEFNPAFADGHFNLGKALFEQGKLLEATACFSNAVQVAPDDAGARYNLGALLSMQGEKDQAMVCFAEALRLNPEYGPAHASLGVALMRRGQAVEGAAHLVAAARLNPSDPWAHDNLGLAFLELHQFEEAAAQFSEALRLKPDAAEPHHHLALALVKLDKPKDALPHAQKAYDLALSRGQSALAASAEGLVKQLQ